jgi:predicted nucleotidyltransferase
MGRQVRVASLDDLAAMKRAAGREKDLDHLRDIEALKSLMNESLNQEPGNEAS